jgi:hypothetical protein
MGDSTVKLYLIDGGKGGNGKSIVAGLACTALERAGTPYALIDTDDSNPDAARAASSAVRCAERPDALCVKAVAHAIGARGPKGADDWAAMLSDIASMADEHPGGATVVSNGARLLAPYVAWGRMLAPYRPRVLWVADTTYASLENLDRYRQAMPFASVTVVLNGGAGGGDAAEDDFKEWHGSELKRGGLPSAYLPQFAIPSVLRRYSNNGLPLHSILDDPGLTVGERIMYAAWLDDAVTRIAGALGIATGGTA